MPFEFDDRFSLAESIKLLNNRKNSMEPFTPSSQNRTCTSTSTYRDNYDPISSDDDGTMSIEENCKCLKYIFF